ncbi:MAG: outer membrane protein assembly factor BamA [Nitrospiraceae bacterium]|nr:outer membrane protein assembly factor BamA [Nitrospiraceae bacterium]
MKKADGFSSPKFLFLLACLLFFLLPGEKGAGRAFGQTKKITAGPGEKTTPGPIEIKKIEVQGLYTIDKDQLIYLLCLRSAKIIVPENLARGIKRAFKKGIFEYISVGEDADRPGVIIVRVREKDRIKDISFHVKGEGPSGGFLEGTFLFKERDFMRYDLLEKARTALGETLSLAGYPDAAVKVRVERIPKKKDPYNVRIDVSVSPGPPVLVKKVNITGAPAAEVAGRIKTGPGDVYDQFKLKEQLAGLKDFYLKRHYVNPQVGPYSFSKGVLLIVVNPGKRYEAHFYGNHDLGKKKLENLLPFMEAGDVTDELVEEAVQKIKDAYREVGRPYAEVAPVVQRKGDNYTVKFYVSEDGRIKVDKVSFTGVSLPAERLQDFLMLRKGELYNPDLLDADRSGLQDFFYSLGYLDASVAAPKVQASGPGLVAITYNVKEGGRYVIGEVDVQAAPPFSADELRKAIRIKPGDVYNEVDITNARYRVLELYNKLGYADCSVGIKRDFNLPGRRARLVYTVNAGPKYVFGKNIIVGNYDTKAWVIWRELLHKEGDPFSQKTVMKERQRLYEMGIFDSVDVSEMPAYNGATFDTVYRVKESKPGAVEFGAGYGEYEKYRGFLGLSYKNLFGMDRLGSARFEFSSLMRRLIVNYDEPWFLGHRLPFRAYALAESREQKNYDTGQISYKLVKYSATAGVEKQLTTHLKVELYHEFSIVRTYDVLPGVILSREDVGTLAISAIRPAVGYDTRDNPFNPTRGVFAGATLKLASAAFLSQTNFAKLIVRGAKYQSLSSRLVLAYDARVGLAEGLGSTHELPIVERFFLGGRDSVRGYTQDSLGPTAADGTPIGGNAFFVSNLELRTWITKNWGIVPFLDAGNVWLTLGQIKPLDIRFATGLGLRYLTPVGPIRLDYGIKLSRREGESRTKIDFSIGHAF